MSPSIRVYVGLEETEEGTHFVVGILGIYENALVSPESFKTPSVRDFMLVIRNRAMEMGISLRRVNVVTLFDKGKLSQSDKDLLMTDFDEAIAQLETPITF